MPCATEGTTTNLTATVTSHADNHDHTWCPSFLNRTKTVRFSAVTPTTLLLDVQDLPSPLSCSVSASTCAGSCQATFPQLAGQQNVAVRLENMSLSGGAFQGRLSFGFPGQPFVVGLSGTMPRP